MILCTWISCPGDSRPVSAATGDDQHMLQL